MTNPTFERLEIIHGLTLFPLQHGGKRPEFNGWPEWTDGPGAARNAGINCHGLLVIDVDVKDGRDGPGSLARLEGQYGRLPDTLVQRTPSGGFHYVFAAGSPVGNSAGRLGEGLDVRGERGYVVAAGSVVGTGEYVILHDRPIADAPDWLVNLAGAAPTGERDPSADVTTDNETAMTRALSYLSSTPPPPSGERNATCWQVAAHVKDFGLSEPLTLQLMLTVWNPRLSEPMDDGELTETVRKAYLHGRQAVGASTPEAAFRDIALVAAAGPAAAGPADDSLIEQAADLSVLQKRFLGMQQGAGFRLFDTQSPDIRQALITIEAFQNLMGSNDPLGEGFTPSDVELFVKTRAWNSWRSFDTIPPPLKTPPKVWNTWKGMTPGEIEDFDEAVAALDLWMEHLHTNITTGNAAWAEWILNWFAHMVQFPGDKPLSALVLYSAGRGTGKNAFIERIAAMCGSHSKVFSNSRYLESNFNAHLYGLLLAVFNEAFWSGNKNSDSILKSMITEREMMIELKGVDPVQVRNFMRVVIMGNDSWIVPAAADERRYAVFEVGEKWKQHNDVFQRMRIGMDQAGGGKLLFDMLMAREVDHELVNRPPQTPALRDQKLRSLNLAQVTWHQILSSGCVPGAPALDLEKTRSIPIELFIVAARAEARNSGARWANAQRLLGDLRAILPAGSEVGLTDIRFPGIIASRKAFDELMGVDSQWPPYSPKSGSTGSSSSI